jgi:hypothetical protein
MDLRAAKGYLVKLRKNSEYWEEIIAEMDTRYVYTWSWCNVVMDEDTGANLVAIFTGFGDGGYASYFGKDAESRVCCLVTDFGILGEGDDHETA